MGYQKVVWLCGLFMALDGITFEDNRQYSWTGLSMSNLSLLRAAQRPKRFFDVRCNLSTIYLMMQDQLAITCGLKSVNGRSGMNSSR